jgi:hypothetical protein
LGPGLRPSMGGPVRYITSAASHSYGGVACKGKKRGKEIPSKFLGITKIY